MPQRAAQKLPETKSSHLPVNPGDYVGGYKINQRIGKGRTASVYSGRISNKLHAIKIYRKSKTFLRDFKNEVLITNVLTEGKSKRSENVLLARTHYMHMCLNHKMKPRMHPCIVFDLMPCSAGELIDTVYDESLGPNIIPIDESVVNKIMEGVFSGLSFLKSREYIHCDIKPDNVLLNKNTAEIYTNGAFGLVAKIADLGGCEKIQNTADPDSVGTLEYCAPELWLRTEFSSPVDVWSAYVMWFELLTGKFLFDIHSSTETKYQVETKTANTQTTPRGFAPMDITMSDSSSECETETDSDSDQSENSSASEDDESDEVIGVYLRLVKRITGKLLPEHEDILNEDASLVSPRDDIPDHKMEFRDLINANVMRDPNVFLGETFYSGLDVNPETRITAETIYGILNSHLRI